MSTEGARAGSVVVVGLVGRAGSGKSSFARALAERGAVVVEADRIGQRITDADPEVRAALIADYGPEVYRADGALDRARVAGRVFSDPDARGRLDALVHPRLVRILRDEVARLRREAAARVVVVDAALMLDWGFDRDCDVVVAVVAPEERQLERLMQARSWSAEHARRRLAVQRSNQEFAARADVVVANDGTEEALRARAHGLFEAWMSSGGARPRPHTQE